MADLSLLPRGSFLEVLLYSSDLDSTFWGEDSSLLLIEMDDIRGGIETIEASWSCDVNPGRNHIKHSLKE